MEAGIDSHASRESHLLQSSFCSATSRRARLAARRCRLACLHSTMRRSDRVPRGSRFTFTATFPLLLRVLGNAFSAASWRTRHRCDEIHSLSIGAWAPPRCGDHRHSTARYQSSFVASSSRLCFVLCSRQLRARSNGSLSSRSAGPLAGRHRRHERGSTRAARHRVERRHTRRPGEIAAPRPVSR